MKRRTKKGFTPWLRQQRHRDDPIGDLAKDATNDPNWPKWQRRGEVFRHYLQPIASRDALLAFERAWSEWSGTRQGHASDRAF